VAETPARASPQQACGGRLLLGHYAPQNKLWYGSNPGSEVPLIDCPFTAHPSFVSIPKVLRAVSQLLSVANGDNDECMGQKGMQILMQILKAKNHEYGEDKHEAVV
jgi:hypothetical protein